MSSYNSGVVILAEPVVMTVQAVSVTAAAISAAAEKYRKYRLGKAEIIEQQTKSELDQARKNAEANQKEYEETLNRRRNEEIFRRRREDLARGTARKRMQEEIRETDRLMEEIGKKIELMEKAIAGFETEFGEDTELRDMADNIRQSRGLLGNTKEVAEELDDLLDAVIPGMTAERRSIMHGILIGGKLGKISARNYRLEDTGREFISLDPKGTDGKTVTDLSPLNWDSFTVRVRAVAETETAYYETEASELLEEMENVAPGKRNFFILRHLGQLSEMEEKVSVFSGQQAEVSEQIMDEFYMYIALTRKLGVEPRFSREDLSDASALRSMREATEIMKEQCRKSFERQYTVNAFTTVMMKYHLVFENMIVRDDGLTSIEFSMDDQAGVRITYSDSGAFEMQFQGRSRGSTVSLDEERMVLEKSKSFCSLYPEIGKDLQEKWGISFAQTALQPPSTENIEFLTEGGQNRREKAKTVRALQMEQ